MYDTYIIMLYIHIYIYMYIHILWLLNCCSTRTHQKIMKVSRATPDVTTKPKCYDLTNMLVPFWLLVS